ncbi:cutinase precursor [Seiridium cupressi]
MLLAILISGFLAACSIAVPVVYTGSIYEVPGGVSIDELVARGEPRLVPRQSSETEVTANEFLDTGCKDVVFVYARGSTQDGNLGDQPGPQLAASLQDALGADRVAIQGVDYPAGLPQNLIPGGTDPSDAADMADLVANVSATCPDSQIVVSGYSQGAAMVHRSVEQIDDQAVKDQIVAAVTFGDTQKEQDDDQVPTFDTAKTLVLCNDGDKVCNGTLIITKAHLDYTGKVQQASDFITGLIQ